MESILANVAGKIRRAVKNGREYLVAPLSLIVPGVLNGSKGALYYPSGEVAKNPGDWNDIPLVLYHPFDHQGSPVSASHPGVAERQGIGFVTQASANGKLRAEGWFDVVKVQQLDGRILNALKKGEPIELSTGLYTENEPAPLGANYNGKSYEYIARNYKPDHVAVLPDQVGACSVQDGCGVLVNKRESNMTVTNAGNNVDKSPLDKGYREGTSEASSTKCPYCGSPTGVDPATRKCIDCGEMATKKEATTNERTIIQKIASLLGFNKDADAPSEIDPTAPAKGLGKGNWSLGSRANHAKALTESAEASSGAALENPSGHEPALKIHEDAMYAHIAAYEEARSPSASKGEPDYSAAGYHKNKADYHQAKIRYHGAQALMHKNKIERGEAVAVNRDISDETREKHTDADFAGPPGTQSFPIFKAEDVAAAVHSLGRTKHDQAGVKKRIKAIAKRKGFALPDAWKNEKEEAENESYGYSGAINSVTSGAENVAIGEEADKSMTVDNCYGSGMKDNMAYNDAGAASTDAGMASMSTGHDEGMAQSVEAIGHAKGKNGKKAAKSHLAAAASHEDQALRLRKDGYHDRAHEHDNAAALHRKAASMHSATTNKEFSSADERKAAFAAMEEEGGTKSASAIRATRATEHQTGKEARSKSHEKAAQKHLEAAGHHEKSGNKSTAEYHRKAASEHRSKVSKNTENIYYDSEYPMTPEQRERLVTVNLKCSCDEEKAHFLGMSDTTLIRLANNAKTKEMGKDLDFSEGEEEEDIEEGSDLHSFDGKPRKTKAEQAGGKGTPDEYNTNNTAQTMSFNQLPREIQEDVRYARTMRNRERQALVERIVTVNAADEKGRTTLRPIYAKMDLAQLQTIASALPVDNLQRMGLSELPPMYLGASTPATNSAATAGPVDVEGEWPPVLNWKDRDKWDKQAS